MEAQDTTTAIQLLLPSTLSAAIVGFDMSPRAADAILAYSVSGTPIPPDYWPELQQCTGLLRELADALEGTDGA